MTYTTTPPSEPGWYWIKPKDAEAYPCKFKEGFFVSQQWTAKPNLLLAYDYTFGPKIEPPRDDDEELATVEWLIAQGISGPIPKGLGRLWNSTYGKELWLHYRDIDGEEAILCFNPTRRKVRQIVEALR